MNSPPLAGPRPDAETRQARPDIAVPERGVDTPARSPLKPPAARRTRRQTRPRCVERVVLLARQILLLETNALAQFLCDADLHVTGRVRADGKLVGKAGVVALVEFWPNSGR